MTPKEKAINLIEKFAQIQRDFNQQNYYGQAKKCALICVDEIIYSSPSLPILSDNGSYGSDIELSTIYWQGVKSEIEKL